MRTKKKVIFAGSDRFEFVVLPLSNTSHGTPPPVQASLGDPSEPIELYRREIETFGQLVGPEYVSVPFVFPQVGASRYGDFVGSLGQASLKQTMVVASTEVFHFTPFAQKTRRFAELAQFLRFPKSEQCACVRGLRVVDGRPTIVLGPGPYEGVFATMNSQGLRLVVSERQLQVAELLGGDRGRKALNGLSGQLVKKYGNVTVRRAVHAHFRGLPDFDSGAVSYLIGMAAVITTKDGYAVFGRRARKKVSVNTGINLATSGGFVFDRERIESAGFAGFVEQEILREAREEVGILGKDCSVTTLALLRELSRAGSPEILAWIEFFGNLKDLFRLVANNNHPEQDVDSLFALPISEARRLVRSKKAGKVLQPKALATLIMLDRHMLSVGQSHNPSHY